MTIQKRPAGRYAVTVYDRASRGKRHVGTFGKLADARKAEAAAKLEMQHAPDETVAAFHARWVRDFPRPKESTNRHNHERTTDFTAAHGRMRLADVDARTVDRYLQGDQARAQRVPALRAMWNDARRRGLVVVNPWANLGLSRTKGNREKTPPSQDQVAVMLAHAWRLTPPSFAGWLACATSTGMRPGELDALRWEAVNFDAAEIDVREQWSPNSRSFALPKNGKARVVALTPPARDALLRLHHAGRFVFTTTRGTHYTPSSRAFHWNRVRAATGLDDKTLYLCTRHYAAWYMLNVLDLPAPIVAHQLGHEDGGRLVETLYGHRDRGRSRERIMRAWGAEVTPLRPVDRASEAS